MRSLFDQTVINGMELKNRFVRSATYEAMAADDGAVTPKLIETMTNLAKGGVGMIITGQAYVTEQGQAGPWQLGVYKDELIPGLREMADAVHEHGGKVVLQLAHAGKLAFGHTPLVVSNPAEPGNQGQEIGMDDIQGLVAAFADAANRAKAAGCDGVQIHCAHGYLLSQFLTPAYNCRQDQYGGSIENRIRIHLEIIRAVRKAVGEKYPVLVKLNCQDFIENGLTLEDSLEAGRVLSGEGIDAIELSGGLLTGKLSPLRTNIKNEDDEAYFRNEAKALKSLIDIPLILVGGMRSFHVAEKIVEEGTADYISLCRPFIRESNLINRWKSGDLSRAKCLSDNKCFNTLLSGNGVTCALCNPE